MITAEQLAALRNNPQMLDRLTDSPIDPHAVMQYQMGGPMPELPGVTMGVGNPPAPQPSVPPTAPANPMSGVGIASMGLGMLGKPQTPPPPGGGVGAPIVGNAPKMQFAPYLPPVQLSAPQDLSQLLAGFRK